MYVGEEGTGDGVDVGRVGLGVGVTHSPPRAQHHDIYHDIYILIFIHCTAPPFQIPQP